MATTDLTSTDATEVALLVTGDDVRLLRAPNRKSPYGCHVLGHYAAGMLGTITVI